ncbi:outer membrane beta-barrel protein [Carboxylicivirga caseinilyticus]|uniref:outer membrane beta-barrel protein n=1 Tax=Carboxylicivirga caseinilyticus TaxID=3417572 RepID=UPI003D3356E8|nr:outer membrane beta-barrel protein [Marinilabiliaceae bacterium A049]
MKKTIVLFVLLYSVNTYLHAQSSDSEVTKFKLGLSYSSFGSNDVFRFNELIGAASYDGDNFYNIGLIFSKPLNSWLEMETGLEYSQQSILITPAYDPQNEIKPYNEDFGLIEIPVLLKLRFLKYLFINGGALISFDTNATMSVDSQNGLGGVMGVGAQYDFKCGAAVFVNPYFKLRALIGTERYQQHVAESGTRIGFTYNF